MPPPPPEVSKQVLEEVSETPPAEEEQEVPLAVSVDEGEGMEVATIEDPDVKYATTD